jgi:hypothetical protein
MVLTACLGDLSVLSGLVARPAFASGELAAEAELAL